MRGKWLKPVFQPASHSHGPNINMLSMLFRSLSCSIAIQKLFGCQPLGFTAHPMLLVHSEGDAFSELLFRGYTTTTTTSLTILWFELCRCPTHQTTSCLLAFEDADWWGYSIDYPPALWLLPPCCERSLAIDYSTVQSLIPPRPANLGNRAAASGLPLDLLQGEWWVPGSTNRMESAKYAGKEFFKDILTTAQETCRTWIQRATQD